MLFDEDFIFREIQKISSQPKFKSLLKAHIMEVIAEMEKENIPRTEASEKISKDKMKILIKEALKELEKEKSIKKEVKAAGKQKVTKLMQTHFSKMFELFFGLLDKQILFILMTIALLIFMAVALLTRFSYFLYATIASLLIVCYISFKWHRDYRTIFGRRH